MADEADMADAIVAEHIARGLGSIDRAIPAGVAGECDGCGEVMPRLVGGLCGFCRDGRRPPLSFYDADRAPSAPAPAPQLSIPSNTFASPPGGAIRSGEDDARGAASRTPPVPEAALQPDPQPAPAPSPEETEMVSYASGAKPITVPTPPEVYHHVEALAESLKLPMGRAALVLIERGIGASADASNDVRQFADPVIEGGADKEFRFDVLLTNVPDTALAAEVARRLTTGVGTEDYDSAIARAEAAESELAAKEVARRAAEDRLAQIKQLLGQAG